MPEKLLSVLETQIERLVQESRRLREENAFLQEMLEELEKERNLLQESQSQTRLKIEAVVQQLQAWDTVNES